MPVQTRSAARRETYEAVVQKFQDARKTVSNKNKEAADLLFSGKKPTDPAYIASLETYKAALAAFKEARVALRAHPEYNKKRSAAATALLNEFEDTGMEAMFMGSAAYMAKTKELMKRLMSPEGVELMSAPDGDGVLFRKNVLLRCANYTKKNPDCIEFAVFSSGVKGMCYAIEQLTT